MIKKKALITNFPFGVSPTGSINRSGPVPAFLRSPSVIPAPLDMKPFLQFSLESPHPASIGLFHNFNTVSHRNHACKWKHKTSSGFTLHHSVAVVEQVIKHCVKTQQ